MHTPSRSLLSRPEELNTANDRLQGKDRLDHHEPSTIHSQYLIQLGGGGTKVFSLKITNNVRVPLLFNRCLKFMSKQ